MILYWMGTKIQKTSTNQIGDDIYLYLSLVMVTLQTKQKKMNMHERVSTVDEDDDVVFSSLLPGPGAVYQLLTRCILNLK